MLTDIYDDFGGLPSPGSDVLCPIIGTKTEHADRVIPQQRRSVTSLLCPIPWYETQTDDGIPLVLNSDGLLPSKEELEGLLERVQNTLKIPERDVLTINDDGLKTRAGRARSGVVGVQNSEKQIYLYLAKNNRNKLTKIGITTNPVFREHTLMSQEPEVDFIFHRNGSRAEEKFLHSRFSSKRVRGEWFSLSDQDVEWCKGWNPKVALPLTESSNTENTTTPSGKARNTLLDALVSIDGSNPLQVTASAFGSAAKALKEIRAVMPEVTPSEISRRASNYRTMHRDWALTPLALSKHWAACEKLNAAPLSNRPPITPAMR